MKRSSIIGIIFTILPLVSGQTTAKQLAYMNYMDHPWVDSVLSSLSMEEKIAQTLWVVTGPDDRLQEIIESVRAIRDHGLGGLIFTASPNEQMQELADYCRSFSNIPLAIALEGRWEGQYPDIGSLAAIASDSLRYLAGAQMAAGIRKKGVQLIMTKGMDDAVAAGLTDKHIQVIGPESAPGFTDCIRRMEATRISELGKYLETLVQDDSIDHRARQVLAFKYWIRQQAAESGSSIHEMTTPGAQDPSSFIRDLYAHSLTVMNNRDQVIPVKELENTRIACLAVNQQRLTDFQKMAGMYTRTDNYFWTPGSENTDTLAKQLATYDLVLAAVYPGQFSETGEALLSSIMQQTQLVVVWFGGPASLAKFTGIAAKGTTPGPEGLILTYEQNPMTESLAVQLIFGGIAGRGRLPVAVGEHYPAGYGITTPGGLRLQYGFPENAGLCSARLIHAIDSIVKRGLDARAYPGCQVIVARKGTVVFQKAYGYHTYEKRIEVRKRDLYDLASVTKISGPLSGLMLLEGMGKFSYLDPLGDYCPAMKGSDKASLALKDVLTHQAGLYPWIPYHENTLKKNGQYKKRFIRPDAGGKYTLQVADRLYLSNTYKEKIFREIRKSKLGEQKYLYSGLSFFLFPTIIEELSGMPYETFLSENIYHRLGAWELLYHPRSSFPGSRIVPTEYDSLFRKQLLHGYVHDEGAALMGAFAGNAGLFASANDLLKLIEMYRRMGKYGGEQIIQEEVLREYSSYQFPELENRRGLGFDKPLLGEADGSAEDYPCPGASPSSFGHSGFTGTFVWADPENEISYVFLTNRVHTTRTNQLLYEMNIRTSILQSVYDSIIDP
jgi:CubicO group peptidase (beta-lactamase class C family)